MSYTAAFSYQPSPRTSFQMAVYDGISSFGRQLNDNLADLSTSFIATRNPFSGDLTGCAFGAQSGGVCFNDVLQSISAANFRHRGVAAQLTSGSGFWNYRSEEHTSELQSLMRISYAVFCLKKKQHTKKE